MQPTLAAPAPTSAADPTKVSGRRFGAYLIDFVLLGAIAPTLIFFAVSRPTIYTDSPGCSYLEVRELVSSSDMCFEVTNGTDLANGTWVLPNTGFAAAAIYLVVFLVAIEWILQGATGMTIGKVIFGIRTVNASGTGPGLGKQLIRGVVWLVDVIEVLLPIAAWSILLTKRNQRLGDLAAGTFVVLSSARGAPVPGEPVAQTAPVAPAAPAAPAGVAYAPPPAGGYPAAPPVADPVVASGGWAAPPPPSDPTSVHTATSEPTIIQPAVTGPSDGDATVADTAVADATDTTAVNGGPQWDPARNAYIQWDPHRGTWLMYDDAASEWTPIS